jgi:hypothetical protein
MMLAIESLSSALEPVVERMTTTLNVYKKQITPEAFKAGMKMLEAATKRS